MKNILVPVGSTENGINNLKYAVNFATMSGATVYLINIYKAMSKAGGMSKVTQFALEENEAQSEEVLNAVDTQGVEVIAKPIKGDPFEGIARVSKQLNIDLIILSPQSVDIKDEVYLGSVTGKLVKQTEIPLLIVPRNFLFRKAETILLAVKQPSFGSPKELKPLRDLLKLFSAKLHVLRVKTPDSAHAEMEIDPELRELAASFKETDNATIYHGVLEHFQSHNPDILCVVRRKRGFFQKLWEKNTVLKKEFYTSKPLLVITGS